MTIRTKTPEVVGSSWDDPFNGNEPWSPSALGRSRRVRRRGAVDGQGADCNRGRSCRLLFCPFGRQRVAAALPGRNDEPAREDDDVLHHVLTLERWRVVLAAEEL